MIKTNTKKCRDTLFFSRWTRSGFGIFQSQGKQIAIATTVLAISLVFGNQESYAQVDTTKNEPLFELDEIIVNGEQEPMPFSKIARIVTIISQKEIEAAPVSDINELLEYALGIEIRQRGPNGVQADISMRGGTFDQTAVLLNGVNISDPQTGHHNLNLPIDINSIERIEILTGPAAMIFGVNAFNGAINIITNQQSPDQIKILVKIGQFESTQQNASILVTHKNISHLLSIGNKRSNGYLTNDSINNTDYNSSNVFYHAKWTSTHQQLDFQIGTLHKEFGANSFYTPAYPEQFEATRTYFGSMRYTLKNRLLTLKPNIYYRRHHDRFELFRNTAPDWYLTHNYHMTDVAGAQLPLIIQIKTGAIMFSLNHRYEHIYSNTLGNPMSGTLSVPNEKAQFDHQAERFHTGLQLSYALDINKIYFTAGLFASHYSPQHEEINIYPAIEASYAILDNLRLMVSYNEAMRMPTFTDLYYNGPSNVGNANLKPEKSSTAELGFKFMQKNIQLQGSAFIRNGENIIEWVKESEAQYNAVWKTQNLTQVIAKGIIISATIKTDKILNLKPLKHITINYAWLNENAKTQALETKYITDNLKHNLNIRLAHSIYKSFYADWGFQFQDRTGSYTEYNNNRWGEEISYKPYWLVNTKVGWNKNQWNIFIEAFNLFNQKHCDISNIPQPGRWLQMGVAYKLLLN